MKSDYEKSREWMEEFSKTITIEVISEDGDPCE